jgi:tRNA threonylcarbamoyladenosine biosynthesis protein TsaE
MLVSLDQLGEFTQNLISKYPDQRIFLLKGEMGAGKTTFTKAFCSHFHPFQQVVSPTFSIANVYDCKEGGELFHFDLYRLNSAQEALDVGLLDYIFSGNYCLIEWPEMILNMLPESYVQIEIESVNQENLREIKDHLVQFSDLK